jgi:rubrerythrin
MSFTTATVLYCALLAGLFLGLWIYYDRRDHARFEATRRRRSYHCARCGHLYALPQDPDAAPCPRCGHANSPLKF